MTLPKPTPALIRRRLDELDAGTNLNDLDRAVQIVFEQWPRNVSLTEILVKVAVLNQIYGTNIYDINTVAEHVLSLSIDERLGAGDTGLVADIARVEFKKGMRTCYSFATKYCAWHRPDDFQIYDRWVDEMLWRYQKAFAFHPFKQAELRDYPRFVEIADAFGRHFGLTDFSRREIDRFLWSEGRST